MDVRAIPAEATHALRQRILRPHQRVEDMVYPGDLLDGTFHLGCYVEDALIGIVSMSPEPLEERASAAPTASPWRLRGMAVVPASQGLGAGRALVEAALREAKERGGTAVWCNARMSAHGLYAGQHFEDISEVFEPPNIGPHVVMRRLLAPRP